MSRLAMKRLLSIVLLAYASACGTSREANAAGEVAASSDRDLARAIAQSDELRAARAEIEQGHPWRATQMLAPVLRDPLRRTPAAIVVAARAAAGWNGWPEVEKLLANETWIDAQFGGEARELLTRSALDRGAD